MKTRNIIIAVAVVVILLAAWILYFFELRIEDENFIGGQRDEHGCLGPAGYSWNATERECVREWEIGDGRYQVTNFATCKDAGYGVMESLPRKCDTPGGRRFVE